VIKDNPDIYYLGIGVANHPDNDLVLMYPDDDVRGLQKAFKAQENRVYKKVISKTLIDEQATRRNVIKSIKNFFQPAKRGDIAVLFIAGHGINTETGYYFVGYDGEVEDLETTGISWQIFKAVNDLKAHVILLADTCHSGSISGNEKLKEQAQVDPSQYLRDANLHNVIIFASSSGADYSMEHVDWGHGAFTKALLEGLNGKATLVDENEVKLSTLQSYVKSRVRKLTDNFQNPTIPTITGSGDFFELVLAKK